MLKLFRKVISFLLMDKKVKNIDIASSYDKISKKYEKYFLDVMHRHNDKVLDLLLQEISKKQDNRGADRLQILDLACGTGYNTRYLIKEGITADYKMVDLSKGMLNEAKDYCRDSANISYENEDMLTFLRKCPNESYHIIICMWAIKYQPPQKVIRECKRVLKKDGLMAVIVNTADTLPQMRSLYPKLLIHNWRKIKKVMFDLPNPKNRQVFCEWFTKADFRVKEIRRGRQTFKFNNTNKLVEFLTSTGALAGYDVMLDLRNDKIKKQMECYFNKKKIFATEHRYVYGLFGIGD